MFTNDERNHLQPIEGNYIHLNSDHTRHVWNWCNTYMVKWWQKRFMETSQTIIVTGEVHSLYYFQHHTHACMYINTHKFCLWFLCLLVLFWEAVRQTASMIDCWFFLIFFSPQVYTDLNIITSKILEINTNPVTDLKQTGLQSSFRCSGWLNISNFMRQKILDRWSNIGRTVMSKCFGLKCTECIEFLSQRRSDQGEVGGDCQNWVWIRSHH